MMKRKSKRLRRDVIHGLKLLLKRSPLGPVLIRLSDRRKFLWPALRLGRAEGWETAARSMLSAEGRQALIEPRFITWLSTCINTGAEMEFLLTEVRRLTLLELRQLVLDVALQPFFCALIRQCINNEFIFAVTPQEKAALSAEIQNAVSVGTDQLIRTKVVECLYAPSHQVFDSGGALVELLRERSPLYYEVISTEIANRNDERRYAASIETLRPIGKAASLKVREQYEAFPYPRWVNIAIPPSKSRQEELSEFFSSHELEFLSERFDVLLPGSGTCRKAIQLAHGYGDKGNLLAVDLSRASLAYGMRMAEKYRAANLDFLHGDILDLPLLQRQFDIVECTGVLHHMANPLEGWRSILEVTRSGGLVHVSLYSSLARTVIAQLRRQAGFDSHFIDGNEVDGDYIREYRRWLMKDAPQTVDELPSRSDFFDMSRCRDLLFHVIEHRYTIPQIKEILDECGLEFRGLEPPDPVPNRIWNSRPKGSYSRDLDRWWEYEQANPRAFANLYEIWALKK